MDFNKIGLPKPKNTRILSGALADLDYYKLKVGCKLQNKSLSTTGQTALYSYIGRVWADDEKRLEFEAARLGITPEELFQRLAMEGAEE